MKKLFQYLNRVDHDGVIRHGLLVLCLLHIGSVANLAFHMSMGRLLSEAEYGILAALLGAFFMFFTPFFFSMQNTLAHFSKHLFTEGRLSDIRFLAWEWTKKCTWGGGAVLLAALLACGSLAALFNLNSPGPVVMLVFILFASLFMPIFAGAFQGMQRFVWMGVSSHLWTLVRLVAAVALVFWVAPKTYYVMAAHFLGVLIAVWIGVKALCRFIPDPVPSGCPIEKANRYFFLSLTGLFFYSVLMNADIVMVKMFFADDAVYGPYARASVIGRLIVFIAQPIAGALFPKVAARKGMTTESLGALLKAIVLSSVLIGSITLVFTVYPCVPLAVLFGDWQATPATMNLVRLLVWAMTPLGLMFLIINFELAQNRFAVLWPLGLCAVFFVTGFALYHPSPAWAGYWLLAASLLAALLLVGLVALQKKRVAAH